jgi:preprotein translocase subunit YajC
LLTLAALLDATSCLAQSAQRLTLLAQGTNAPGPEPTPLQSLLGNPFVPIAGLFFLYYFIVIAPERRRKREDTIMKSSLKKNDRIVTIGGIHGTVVAAPPDSDVVTIRIDESGNTRVKINRSAIATIVSDKDGQDGKSKEPALPTKEA